MEYFSESYFRNITNNISLNEQRTYSERVQEAPLDKQFDIFLSYNISDLNVVKGIYYVLSKMGFKVYLDCMVDPDMKRDETDKSTAEKLQNRLKHNIFNLCSIFRSREKQLDAMGTRCCRRTYRQMHDYACYKRSQTRNSST